MFFDNYLEFLNTLNVHNNIDSLGYSYRDGEPVFDNFSFYNAILFLYHIDIKPADVRLQKLKNLTDYMKFFIFREKSDLSKFKSEWLLLITRKYVQERISKIKPLKKIIEMELKKDFNEEIAKIYTSYYLKID